MVLIEQSGGRCSGTGAGALDPAAEARVVRTAVGVAMQSQWRSDDLVYFSLGYAVDADVG